MLKKRITFVIITMIAVNIILLRSAQSKDNNLKSGRGDVILGVNHIILEVNHIDIHDLNTTLKRNGYSPFSDKIIGIGLGRHDIIKNRFVYEGNCTYYFPRSLNSTVGTVKYKSSLSGFLGFYNIGYLLYSQRGFAVFPLMGFGFGMMKITINEREKQTLNEILENPRGSTVEIYLHSVANFALGIDKLLYIIKKEENFEKGIGIGIRLGYRCSLGKPYWSNVTGRPGLFFTGPYVSVMFGSGYNKKK